MTASGDPMSLPISLSLDDNVSCLTPYENRAWAYGVSNCGDPVASRSRIGAAVD
jgi:hypothetical protein